MAGERNRSVDICKGILTVTMILGHCIQFFGFEEEGLQKILVNVINLTTFSGFLFCFGFVGNLAYYENRTFRRSAWKLAKNAARLLIAFYVSGIAYMAFVEDKIFRWDFITEILLLKRYPGWSEFLASFAAMMAAGILLYPLMKRMNGWILAGIAVVSGAACFLPYGEIHNSWLALLAGSWDFTTFPILQYLVYFAAGRMDFQKTAVVETTDSGGGTGSQPALYRSVCHGRVSSRPFPALRLLHCRRQSVRLSGLSDCRRTGSGSGKRTGQRGSVRLSGKMRKSISPLSASEQSSDFRAGRILFQLPLQGPTPTEPFWRFFC